MRDLSPYLFLKDWLKKRRRAAHNGPLLRRQKIKLVIGSGNTLYDGWVSTDRGEIDLLDEDSFQRFLKEKTLTNVLSEHVFEHFSELDTLHVVRNIFSHLEPGGRLRVAVPDGYHCDPCYLDMVRPGGSGNGSDDHKVLYNMDTLGDLMRSAGFDVSVLEGFTRQGVFTAKPWSPEEGYVKRSVCFDKRNLLAPFTYSSLILDGIKPAG